MIGATPDPGLPAGLSPAARAVWAKSEQGTGAWLPLWRHMADSGAVAGLLWDSWAPENVRELIAAVVEGDRERARAVVVWLAATHDVGKATPAFACQVDGLAGRVEQGGEAAAVRGALGAVSSVSSVSEGAVSLRA
ncbi:HD domain-containing protein [Kitasatospora sp. NPDC096147]|uniref:HD domain-containing protein n=1 Tax=Kitasatospora sp. NPDC096147 TaxID=3364093 RepID=UPI0038171D68